MPNAELSFLGEGGVSTFRTSSDGTFVLMPAGTGWAQVDRNVTILKQLTIELGHAPPRDATITGHVRDTSGAPIANALVRASPSSYVGSVATVFATTGPDGTFTLAGVDRASYDLSAEAEDHARGVRANIPGGSRNVALTLDAGFPLAGQVVDRSGAPADAPL